MHMLFPTLSRAGEITGEVILPAIATHGSVPLSPYARARYGAAAGISEGSADEFIAVVCIDRHINLIPAPPPRDYPVVDQKKLTIVPHLLPIQVGTTVRFTNSDSIYHNLFSLSPAKRFDLGRYPKGRFRDLTFDKIGVVSVFCDMHATMSGVIYVMPNSYYVGVKVDGKFRLSDVPAGDYRLMAWHERLGERSQSVTVPAEGEVKVNFDYR